MHIEPHNEIRDEEPTSSSESISDSKPGSRLARAKWGCPMHSSVARNAPGDCPLCGMKLEARTNAAGAEDTRREPLLCLVAPKKETATVSPSQSASPPFGIPLWLGASLFSAIALYFLWDEHKVHILSALPYLLLASCPLIHLLMHRGHDHCHRSANENGSNRTGES